MCKSCWISLILFEPSIDVGNVGSPISHGEGLNVLPPRHITSLSISNYCLVSENMATFFFFYSKKRWQTFCCTFFCYSNRIIFMHQLQVSIAIPAHLHWLCLCSSSWLPQNTRVTMFGFTHIKQIKNVPGAFGSSTPPVCLLSCPLF